MRMGSIVLSLAVLLSVLGCGKPAKVHTAVPHDYSALGDLSEYKKIAEDTLAIVDTGDLDAAKTRIKDLETAWDKAEPAMKPKNEEAWTSVDKAIDHALAQLRNATPVKDKCASSLRGLIVKLTPATNAPAAPAATAAPTTSTPAPTAPPAAAPAASAPPPAAK